MKRKLNPAQLRQRDERKEKFSAIVEQIGAMSDEQRAELASKIMVTNTEGHPLSVRNQMLIALQLGMQCTVVGGFRQWLKQGRCVTKGQHGATILFPKTCGGKPNDQSGTTAEVTAAEANPVRFLSGTVFDISQTFILDEANEQPVTAVPLFVPPAPIETPEPERVRASVGRDLANIFPALAAHPDVEIVESIPAEAKEMQFELVS